MVPFKEIWRKLIAAWKTTFPLGWGRNAICNGTSGAPHWGEFHGFQDVHPWA
jgi:hypothetical protein